MIQRLLIKLVVVSIALIMVLSVPLVYMHWGSQPQSREGMSTDVTANAISVSSATISFTGNVVNDFSGHLVGSNHNTSLWGSNNNVTQLYASFNATYLFLGLYENVSGNSLMVFLSNNTGSAYGTTNMTNLNAWNKNMNFTKPMNYFTAVYFGSPNGGISGENAYVINSQISQSNPAPNAVSIQNFYKFGAVNNTTEIRIPWSALFPYGYSGPLVMNISAFVVGGGAWLGNGIPYLQQSAYNNGGSIQEFYVNNTIGLNFGTVSIPPSATNGGPINLAIIFNNHQPLYTVVGSSNYQLPWTETHATMEYIEQPLIAHNYPQINVTYQLSGSLLYQLKNISTDPAYNNSFIEGAFIPWDQLNSSANRSLLINLSEDYFDTPGYVYQLGDVASNLYNQIHSNWTYGTPLNQTSFQDAKVLWFLYDISTPLVEGQLGQQWKSSVIWGLHNQTSFTQANLVTVLQYSSWLTGQVIPAFGADMLGNVSGSNNIELITSPFYHPLVPLVLDNNISGTQGTINKTSDFSDVLAQLDLAKGQFNSMFGQRPVGVWSPESAVSNDTVAAINQSGYNWTQASEWTLQQSGVDAKDYGNNGNITQMESMYTPYKVLGPNGTSVNMLFRDDYLSNAWGFNYGSMSTSSAVSSFINYLKNIYNSIPSAKHADTLVTVALDGENWMYNGFQLDGVPFLEQLYAGLGANSSFVRTVTPQQYLATHSSLPVIHDLATGSWNVQSAEAPYQSNTALTQWSGYSVQDFYWETLNEVRNLVVSYQTQNALTQITNYTLFEQNLSALTKEGNLTRAWNAIYAAEGSDWTFNMAPWSIGGVNTQPFDFIFKGDLAYALQQLGIAVPSYLTAHFVTPYSATSMGQPNQAHTPSMGGFAQNSMSTPIGTGFSITSNNGWSGSIVYNNNSSIKSAMGISKVSIEYNPSDLYIQVSVNGAASSYIGSNDQRMTVYFSPSGLNPLTLGNVSMDVPGANFNTMLGGAALYFPADYALELSPYTFLPSGAGQFSVYSAAGFGQWNYEISDTNTLAYVAQTIQFQIPFSYLGIFPGDTFYMGIFASNLSHVDSSISPIVLTVPSALGSFTPISSIHNTVADNGPGNYTYPNQPTQIPPGSLDLQWINVSMNSYDMRWNFTFGQMWNIWNGPNGFSNQMISVFINENNASGSKALGMGPNANSTNPWQYMIYLSGWNAYVQSSTGIQYTSGIVASSDLASRTASITFPLSIIGNNPEHYGYTIITGSYDGYGTNGWRTVDPVNTSNGGWQGGGGDPPWSSNIYSYIAPATLGEGTLTQQQALQYAPNKIPTLAPVYLPILANSTTGVTPMNYTSYYDTSILLSSGTFYDLFVSNLSGSNGLYLSSSGDMQSWSQPQFIASSSGVADFYPILIGSTVYVLYDLSSNTSTLDAATLTLSGSPILTKIGSMSEGFAIKRIAASYNASSGVFAAISAAGSVSLQKVTINASTFSASNIATLAGYSDASLGIFGGDLYVALTNSSGNLFVDQISGTGTLMHQANLNVANVSALSESISLYGNLWIAYATSGSSGNIWGTNATLNGAWDFSRSQLLVSGTASNYDVSLEVMAWGANSNLVMTWGSTTSVGNTLWAVNSTVSWSNVPVTQVPTPSNLYIYIIIGVAIAAVVVVALLYVFVVRKK